MSSDLSIIPKLLKLYGGYHFRRFEQACMEPQLAQKNLWRKTAARISRSDFWRNHLHPDQDLRDLPLTEYRDYEQVLEDAYGQTINPLNGERILFWAESGGTTAKPKLFPLTASFRRQLLIAQFPNLYSYFARFPGFLRKPVLYFAGTNPSGRSQAGIERGFISNYNFRNLPAPIRNFYAFPKEVLADQETFNRFAPYYALGTDLSAMLAVTPRSIVQFAEVLDQDRKFYLSLLENKESLPAGLPRLIVPKTRLSLVKEKLDPGRPLDFTGLWPSLQFISSWISSTSGLQVPGLRRFVPPDFPLVDALYSATEGWFNVPLSKDQSGGPIHPNALVVELIPEGTDIIMPCWEADAGQVYEMVLTNSMGLVRYRLRDLVLCTGHFHRSPIIEFHGKMDHTLSLGLTRISETQVVDAARAIGLTSAHWSVCPNPLGDGLQLHAPRGELDAAQVTRLDQALSAQNAYYKMDRASGHLKDLALEVHSGAEFWHQGHAQKKAKFLYNQPLVPTSPQV